MLKTTISFAILLCGALAGSPLKAQVEPDSVYLLSYTTIRNNNHDGLRFAWSRDRQAWLPVGNEFGFLRCDYGRWGSEKRMIAPYLIQGPDGIWQCVWQLNEREKIFAHASSPDLVYWGRQAYPMVNTGANILQPVLQYDPQQARYNITYKDATGKYYRFHTKDFNAYSPAYEVPAAQYMDASITVNLPSGKVSGQVYKVAWPVVDKLIRTYEIKQYKNGQAAEMTQQDAQRFAGLKPIDASITLQPVHAKPISEHLIGVFFEDINYAADGGLYAELIQNRDFEYALSDREDRDSSWNSTHSWTLQGNNTSFTIDSTAPIHPNNPHYAVLHTQSPGAALINTGFDGIPVKKGEPYNFSLFAKKIQGANNDLSVSLVNKAGSTLAQTTLHIASGSWQNIAAVLTPADSAADARLELRPLSKGSICLDMISLFPANTFKGRKNGLRADLAQTIADIHPRFIRFPGGCVAHGDGLGNIYRWKNTIGPLEARKPQRNIWSYHQSAGLGYFEYFTFCEDIGAAPLPVLAAGVPCQNSGPSPTGSGQQGGIPMEQMNEYVQDVLDLIEYANGSADSKWGKLRAQAGHPAPFHLKFIGIGNEDLITDIFEARYTMICRAVKQKYPDITVIGTVGPFFEGTDYTEGWNLATREKIPMVDEHYYETPGWFINNQEFYDKYDRNKPKVYLGEYAAHLPGRPNNLETALSEALYLTALERNGDVVSMASYAPLLAKEGHTQWNPDMIYFNNTTVKPTVGYQVQKLYGINSGNQYLPAVINLSSNQESVRKRVAYSIVRDTKSKSIIVKLVNLLPVAVNTAVNLDGLNIADEQVTKTILQGNPADKNLLPVESMIPVTELKATQLPAYSFTIFRIREK